MLEIYHQSIQTAADAAQRIYLRPGDALVVDNYRSLRSQGCCGGGAWNGEPKLVVWKSLDRIFEQPKTSPNLHIIYFKQTMPISVSLFLVQQVQSCIFVAWTAWVPPRPNPSQACSTAATPTATSVASSGAVGSGQAPPAGCRTSRKASCTRRQGTRRGRWSGTTRATARRRPSGRGKQQRWVGVVLHFPVG